MAAVYSLYRQTSVEWIIWLWELFFFIISTRVEKKEGKETFEKTRVKGKVHVCMFQTSICLCIELLLLHTYT